MFEAFKFRGQLLSHRQDKSEAQMSSKNSYHRETLELIHGLHDFQKFALDNLVLVQTC